MKRTTLCMLLASLLLAACQQQPQSFKAYSYDDHRCYVLTADPQVWPDGPALGVDNSYCIQWPASGTLTPEAEAELLQRCFADSTATSFRQAADRWLDNLWLYDDHDLVVHTRRVDSLGSLEPFSYAKKTGTLCRDRNLVTFIFNTETYTAYAAHGLYTSQYAVIDLDTKRIVHLNDLVDTAQLGPVILRAIEDLVTNQAVNECLFDEYRTVGSIAVPEDFYIDSSRSVINLVFQLYDIAPYACGIQTVALPIFWLSKHLPLTPYCKELFGPGSYLE